jgi:tetratricopeptide (TPR) repeat protein
MVVVLTIGTLNAAGLTGPAGQAPSTSAARSPAVTEAAPPPWPFAGPAIFPTPEPAAAAVTATPALAAYLPTPTPTPEPTATPLPTLTPLPTPTQTIAAVQPAPPAVQLTGLRHEWQTWNNCGPATLAMNLSYYGSTLDQATIGAVLRIYPDDKNVSPQELVAYARDQGYAAQLRVDGSADLARAFLANGIPLLIESWLEEQPNDGMGHYRLLVGYDDAAQHWIAYDSYVHRDLVSPDPASYAGIYLAYAETDALWQVFHRTYVLIYPPDREPVVQAILGERYAPAAMWQGALATAQAETAANPNDPFVHFNLGTSLVALGDYAAAAAAYDRARALGLPWRMLWYQFGVFEAYAQMGRYAEMVQLADGVNAITDSIEEIHYWRGRGLEGLGDPVGAQAAYQRALTLNPSFAPAAEALAVAP